MPTVLRIDAFRFYFYSDEGDEPAHIHVDTGDGECKFWLDPVVLAKSVNVSPTNVRKIERLVFEHRSFLMEKYHEFHQR